MLDNTLASDNPSCFRCNLLEKIKILIVEIDNKISDESLQYDINRKAAKISALSRGKNDKYEYPTGEKVYLLSFRKSF